jgi:hypothetical protein
MYSSVGGEGSWVASGRKKNLIMGPIFQIKLALDWFFWLKRILS